MIKIVSKDEYFVSANTELTFDEAVESAVRDILTDVKKRGDEAVRDYTKRFDKVELECLEVTKAEIEEAYASLDGYFIETLKEAKENIERYHREQLHNGYEIQADGVRLGQIVRPLKRVGVYVPGGTAAYPSTVLMDVIPAKIAGVEEVILVSPCRDGKVNSGVLAAAKLAGADRVFRIGGAQAVGALAFGTESVPKVDKIVGPGNAYVATAKKQVFGYVDIDMIAGPSEILIVADDTANARFVASDMLGQAEHDKRAGITLVCMSRSFAEEVVNELDSQLAVLPRAEIARHSIANGKIVVVNDIDEALNIANDVAPEHLELCVEKPFEILDKVKNAGGIFLGHFSPEALGDYYAGTNHTLPTSGTARFASPLSVDDFIKKSSYLYYTEEALQKVGDRVADFATREGLDAHARSIKVRLK